MFKTNADSAGMNRGNDRSANASDLAAVLEAPPEALTVSQYQSLARTTDRTSGKGAPGLNFPLLGLFGEAGSLLSELKKKQRDTDSYIGYEASVIEELGDVLWYLASLATRAEINLSELACRIAVDSPRLDDSDVRFSAFQPDLTVTGPKTRSAFESTLMQLAAEVGTLVTDVSMGRIVKGSDLLEKHLDSIFRTLVAAANDAEVSLAQAALGNLSKIFDRWPQERIYPPLFDANDDTGEQLPRHIEMHIFEKTINDQTYVFLRCNDINIGDRLTDNKLEKDDYRFHDVFHLAYAAVLGWSPVLRALFRVKRKSRPEIDEAEDGARAILIEEGVSTWIFNHATPLRYFENLESVDYGLLKAVRELVSGYEAERCPLWLWEEAILKGYEMFRAMREHRSGIIVADLNERTLTFKKMPK